MKTRELPVGEVQAILKLSKRVKFDQRHCVSIGQRQYSNLERPAQQDIRTSRPMKATAFDKVWWGLWRKPPKQQSVTSPTISTGQRRRCQNSRFNDYFGEQKYRAHITPQQ